jgi:hypothetical protein
VITCSSPSSAAGVAARLPGGETNAVVDGGETMLAFARSRTPPPVALTVM